MISKSRFLKTQFYEHFDFAFKSQETQLYNILILCSKVTILDQIN